MLEIKPGHIGHFDVENDDAGLGKIDCGQEIYGSCESADSVALTLQRTLQCLTHGAVIINDIDLVAKHGYVPWCNSSVPGT